MKKDLTVKGICVTVGVIVLVAFLVVFFMPKVEVPSVQGEDSVKYTIEEAIQGGDISMCDSLIDESMRDTCILKNTVCVAGDDGCFFEKARFEMDERLCYEIVDEDKKLLCTSSIGISSIKQRAVIEDNLSICDEFGDVAMIEFCQDNYYIAKRFNEDNLEFCSQIKNEVIKDECLKTN